MKEQQELPGELHDEVKMKQFPCKGCGTEITVILGSQVTGTVEYGYCTIDCIQKHAPELLGGKEAPASRPMSDLEKL